MRRAARLVTPSWPAGSEAEPASNTTRIVTMGELLGMATSFGDERGSRPSLAAAGVAAWAPPADAAVGAGVAGVSGGAAGALEPQPPSTSATTRTCSAEIVGRLIVHLLVRRTHG